MCKVAVLRTSPEHILEDYHKVMKLAEYKKVIKRTVDTVIKINLSWTKFFPACSTPPWQLDGVLQTMVADKYSKSKIHPVENQTVVTHPWKGAYENKWLPVLKKLAIPFEPLTDVKWVNYEPKGEMLAMTDLFKEILVPEMFMGANVIQLATMKTHGHTTTTGAMKNAFGGLIPKYRHHAHQKIHEVLVDLLTIQQEIHKGIFAVMDGTTAGNGAGPRTMVPYEANMLLASSDQVAIDALSAKIMGFDPMKIDYIRMAHDKGLGIGDVDQIEIVGENSDLVKKLNFRFKTKRSLVIRWDQRLRKGTAGLPWLHNLLFRSPLFKAFIFASGTFHDNFWYPTTGKEHIRNFMKTKWGNLFNNYPYGRMPNYKEVKDWDSY